MMPLECHVLFYLPHVHMYHNGKFKGDTAAVGFFQRIQCGPYGLLRMVKDRSAGVDQATLVVVIGRVLWNILNLLGRHAVPKRSRPYL